MEALSRPQRNVMIDLGRFVYCWAVVFYHIYNGTGIHFITGRYGVEFFLLVAGVFFFRHLERDQDETPGQYIGRRFARLFPWSLPAFIFGFIVLRVVINGSDGKTLIQALSSDIWEALLVKMNGMNQDRALLIAPMWTISSMFLAEIVLVGCYRTGRKTFLNVLLPTGLIVGFGYWAMTDKGAVEDWIGFTTFGTLRALLVYGCGYYCLKLGQYLKTLDLTRLAEVLLTVLETMCHVFALLVMTHYDTRAWQRCVLLAFFVAVAIELSGHSLWNKALQKCAPVAGWLGAFSLSIYLIHRPVTRYFEKVLYPGLDNYYAHLLPLVAAIVVCSLVHYFLVTGLIKFWRKKGGKIKALVLRGGTKG